MPRLALVVVSLVIFTGCNKTNPDYCPNGLTADGSACIDAPPGTGDHCTNEDGCTSDPTRPICDKTLNGGTCVQCTMADQKACTGMMPHCALDTGTCVGCVDDSDCGGTGVCLPSGGCADPNTIVHAISTGGSMDTTTCGGMGAGNACDLNTALSIARAGKNVIKLDDPGPYKSMMNSFDVNTDTVIGLILDARNATLHNNNANTPVFVVHGMKGMTLLGGIIESAQGVSGAGIQCDDKGTLTIYETLIRMNGGSGIAATGCALTATRAIIRDNSKAPGTASFAGIDATKGSTIISQSQLISNRGGGITISGNTGTFVVVGNIFLNNGDNGINGSFVGGLSASTQVSGNRLDFNTFVGNKTTNTVVPGVQCMVTGDGLAAKYNIVWGNDNGTGGMQISGNCTYTYSDIGPAAAVVSGTGNIKDDPLLTNDGHLGTNSPALKKADMNADILGIAAKDIDGHPRIPPADLGAYQAPR
jgi:hypothetical protein